MKRFTPIFLVVALWSCSVVAQSRVTGSALGRVSFSKPISNAPGYPSFIRCQRET